MHYFATFTHTRLFPSQTAYSSALYIFLAFNSANLDLSHNICIFHTFSQHNRISHTRLRSSRALKNPPPFFFSDADGYVRAMAHSRHTPSGYAYCRLCRQYGYAFCRAMAHGAIRPLATPIAGFAVNTATLAPYCASAIRALFLGLSPHIAFLRFDSKILDK